jgi:serine/threonine protein kinase/Flp pilus assembly protein TadD
VAIKCAKCHCENPDDTLFCGKCGTQFPSPEKVEVTETLETPKEELIRGTTLANRYEIIEELGKGGMGRVYRVEDTKLNQEVAIKLIKPEIAKDKKTIERFRNELKTARMIAHKNVCRMFDLGESEGAHFITMEYVRGEDLKSMIRMSGQLGTGTAINIAKQVCDGLAEAHRLGVVHRDLKPQNIMIDKEGIARIMDFGIARSLESKGITGAGVVIGTPEYMSPEQVEGKETDQRSDIYSLGVILYEMVTGSVPFEGDSPFMIGVKHKSEMPRDPKEINTQIPEDLSSVIMRCLIKDKEKRYQSAGEVRSELSNIEKGITTAERIVPPKKPLTSKEITVQFSLKRLFIPAVAVIALAIIAVIIWKPFIRKQAVPIPLGKTSLAVLPFDDLSPGKDQDYLCEGLAESLINALTKIKDLRVAAKTSSFSFRTEEKDIQEIGEKLNVNAILEGSIQKIGNRVRISTRLINVLDESLLWSEQYNRELEDVFAIQDEISLAIIERLKVKLLGEEKEKVVKRYTENLEAYNLYLQGRYYWNKRTEEGLKKGLDYFQQAIKKDPGYSLAYVGLADSYIVLAGYEALSPNDAYPKAKEAAMKALEIDDMLADAYVSLAVIRFENDLDPLAAEKDFKQSIEINPGLANAHKCYAEFLSYLGRHEEAIKEIKLAQELDPLSLIVSTMLGDTYYQACEYDQAIEQYKEVLEKEPNFIPALAYLGMSYIQKSMYEDAISELQKSVMLSSRSPLYIAGLAHAYAVAGKEEEALKIIKELKELSKKKYIPSYSMALIYVGLNEKEQAISWLEKAVEERYFRVLTIKVDPRFDSLHSDSRYKALLKKLRLE